MDVPQWIIDRSNAENAKAHKRAQVARDIDRLWSDLCAAVETAVAGFASLGGAVDSTGAGRETIAVRTYTKRERTPEDFPREEVTFSLDREQQSIRVSFASGRRYEEFRLVLNPEGRVEMLGPVDNRRFSPEKLVEHILSDVFFPSE